MKIFRSKIAALATVGFGAALGLTTTVGQAQEAPVFSDALAFLGTATIVGPTTGPLGCAVTVAAPAYVCIVGGTGGYSFASNTCVGVSDTEVSAACTVSSTGRYQNIVCGTGGAQGTATITEADETDNVTYGIIFVGGVGVVAGNAGPSIGDPAGNFEDFAGVVLLLLNPGTQGNPALNQCVDGFQIASADVALDLPVALPPLPPLTIICPVLPPVTTTLCTTLGW
jgi:hypothetical protein